MGGRGGNSGMGSGMGAEWLDFSGSFGDNFDPNTDERQRAYEYLSVLQQNGVIPANADLEDARRYFRHYGDFDIEAYNSAPFGPKSEMFVKWAEGATERGYGDDKNAFDNKYGLSKFIDSHPNLQLNTNVAMYRGVRTSQGELNRLQQALSSKTSISMDGPSSWTAAERVANNFTKATLNPTGNVRLVYKDVSKGKRKAIPYPYSGQKEAIYSRSARFDVLSIVNKGAWYEVEVRSR